MHLVKSGHIRFFEILHIEKEKVWNAEMSAVPIEVEHGFGIVAEGRARFVSSHFYLH